jgi:adenine-specific DNA-methyltransferase
MSKSLLEQLPEIVREGRKQAEKILENLEGRHRVGLQTRELVLPARDSAEVDWIAENERRERLATSQPGLSGEARPALGDVRPWRNRLIYGDNLLAMAALLAGDDETPSLRGKIDLIYIDPPFDSKADYRTKITLPGVELEQKPTVIEQFAYSDTWADGTASYLAMITPRLILMRELLADSGSIYVHLDWRVGHYVKIMMDEVFGKDNFVNEIIWQPTTGDSSSKNKKFIKSHDSLFFCRKNAEQIIWNDIFQPYDEGGLAPYKYQDEKGRYCWDNCSNPGGGGYVYDLGYGEKIPTSGYRMPKETALRWIEEGMLKVASGKVPCLKRYMNPEGVRCKDVWSDLKSLQSSENIGYGTQKPHKLLERIIKASSNENSLVADFNGGSGTTAAVAEKLGRRWITTDIGKPACMIMRKRLIDQNASPFLYQAIGDYHVEAAKVHFGRRDLRIGDLARIVLSLYGALPLPPEENPLKNLGCVSTNGGKTLVLVDSPNKQTGAATLKKALGLRDNLLGGWDKVVVLGWNFEPSIGESITAMNDERLEVLVIPPDLMDQLKKKGGLEKLRGQVRFASLQYLTLYPITRATTADGQEMLHIRLKNYVLLSPEAIHLDEANRVQLRRVAEAEPLALIEYWAVDPDYDGKVFRSVWQDYRGNVENDDDPLRVVTMAKFPVAPRPGPRRVCVRVVDVFGFEAEACQIVEQAS